MPSLASGTPDNKRSTDAWQSGSNRALPVRHFNDCNSNTSNNNNDANKSKRNRNNENIYNNKYVKSPGCGRRENSNKLNLDPRSIHLFPLVNKSAR